MTAEDVAYSFNLVRTQGILEYRRVVEGYIDHVEVEDPHRITFHFTGTAPMRDRVGFAGGTAVFSKAWFEKTGARLDKATKAPFLSTGAYVLDSFDFNTRVIYKRNPDYWGNDLAFNRGRNNFDRIRVEYFADSDAAFEGFKAGDYTFRTGPRATISRRSRRAGSSARRSPTAMSARGFPGSSTSTGRAGRTSACARRSG